MLLDVWKFREKFNNLKWGIRGKQEELCHQEVDSQMCLASGEGMALRGLLLISSDQAFQALSLSPPRVT